LSSQFFGQHVYQSGKNSQYGTTKRIEVGFDPGDRDDQFCISLGIDSEYQPSQHFLFIREDIAEGIVRFNFTSCLINDVL
jgi:hypothetical protein